MKTLPWKLGFNTFWWTGLEKESAARACADALVEIGYDAVEFKVDSFGPHPAKNAIVQGCHIAREAGLTIVHVDMTIIAQIPRLAPHARQIQENVAHLLELPFSRVNFKATTEEKLGFTGQKLGLKAVAAVTGLRPA